MIVRPIATKCLYNTNIVLTVIIPHVSWKELHVKCCYHSLMLVANLDLCKLGIGSCWTFSLKIKLNQMSFWFKVLTATVH